MPHILRLSKISGMADRALWFLAGCVCVLSLAASLASAQNARTRTLLTPSQIVSAMQERRLPINGVKVRLGAPITAGIANPELEIQSIALLNSHEVSLRMTCRDHSQCLSFFAIAEYPEELDSSAFSMKPERQVIGMNQAVSAVKPVSKVTVVSNVMKPSVQGGPPILKSGSPATLGFDGERVHLRVEVICLQGGAAGDKIRVTTRDRKQIYVAEIVNPVLLKGTF